MNGVSLIICCHNSAEKLPQTIYHVNNLIIPNYIQFEVILVDNASTDETSQIADNLFSYHLKQVTKIITEHELGLKNARLRGIAESQYEYICFIDDDNWICPEWIDIVYKIMSAHPDVGACGGLGLPSFETVAPPWFEQFKGCYAVGPQSETTGYVADSRGYLWGAGLSIRKSAWEEIINNGFTFTLSGRHGTNLSSGEDSEICFALRCFGWRLWYDERLSYYHYLPTFRLTWRYLKKLHGGFGASEVVLGTYREFFNSKPDYAPDFNNAWIADARSIIDSYQNRYMELLFLHREIEGSLKATEAHYQFGKLLAIIKLRSRYDYIKWQIFTFWQGSKVCRDRSRLIVTTKSTDMLAAQSVNSLSKSEKDEMIQYLQLRVDALESSLSWRITKPLRWLGRKIR